MADQGVFRSTGPVAAKIRPALPQYVDQYMGIDFAELDDIFHDTDNNNNNNNASDDDKHTNPNRRPISVVKEIQQQFINDPKTAVKDNVGLHFNPEYLDTLKDKVDHIADARRRQNAVADLLWKDADYEFLQMVMGITRNTTLMNREVTVTKDARMPSLQLLQSNSESDASYMRGQNVRGFWAYNHEQVQQPNGQQQVGQINMAELDRRVTAKKEELQILENVDRLMEEPMVSGEIQMSSVMYGAVNLALVMGLTVKNKDKYKGRTRFDFYPDYHIKVMFANLVRAYIGNTYKEFSDSYSKVVDLPRTRDDITTAVNILDNNCVWSAQRKCFVLSSEKETEQAKEKKRQKLMDAYDL